MNDLFPFRDVLDQLRPAILAQLGKVRRTVGEPGGDFVIEPKAAVVVAESLAWAFLPSVSLTSESEVAVWLGAILARMPSNLATNEAGMIDMPHIIKRLSPTIGAAVDTIATSQN